MTCREKMMKTVVIYRTALLVQDSLADWFESHDWNVIKLSAVEETQMPEAVDMAVIAVDPSYEGADGPVGSAHDYDAMSRRISEGIREACVAVERCLPALEKGEGKRIAILSDRAGSIRGCTERDRFVPRMILAGIHMEAVLLYNQLHKKGYTMRLFADNAMEGQMISAGEYFTMDFSFDPEDAYIHSEENRFLLRDGSFTELPW